MKLENRKCGFIRSEDKPGVSDTFMGAYDDGDKLVYTAMLGGKFPKQIADDGYKVSDIKKYMADIYYDPDVVDGKTPQGISTAEIVTSDTYQPRRKNAFAEIGEQLDMMYHDQVNNTTTWKDHVKSVKDSVPKSDNVQHGESEVS